MGPASASQSEPIEARRPTILIVDDAPQNLTILGELLLGNYQVRVANSGERALRAANNLPRPDLILLDVMMPEMDGYEVLRRLRASPETRDIPVIFITAMASAGDEQTGLEQGAVDYIIKPFNPAIVQLRVKTQLELKAARDRLAQQNTWLDGEVQRRMRENQLIQDLNIRALACLAEARDNDTGHHIVRTQHYVRILAGHLREHPDYAMALAGPRLEQIVKAAPLHDIGKVGIPDAILLKPGRLTEEEFAIMKTHPLIGSQAIRRAMAQALADAGEESTTFGTTAFAFLQVAEEISIAHHEKWDGSGYPNALAGPAIPVSARLMALADVFDALVCRRVYKAAFSFDESVAIIRVGCGMHFDPLVVEAFLAHLDEFTEVACRYADSE